MNYPTEGAQIFAETGKSAMQIVLEEANAPVWVGAYAGYFMNTSPGWRPSDAARHCVSQWQKGYMTEERFNEEIRKMHADIKAERMAQGGLC